MWSKLGVRLTSALIGAIAVISLIIFAPISVFNAVIAVVCYISLYEIYKTFGCLQKWQLTLLGYSAATAVLYTTIYYAGNNGQEILSFILVLYVMLILVCAIIWNKDIKFSDVSMSVFALLYCVLFVAHLALIRQMDNGKVIIFAALLGAWMPDTFAYFSGLLFGKHKLIPAISPNKTVEGSIGAILGCVIIFTAYGAVISHMGYDVNYFALIILAVLSSILAQFGDLSASLIKRQFGVKDFGNIMPGHGGLLDRIDSLIFIAPLTYYFLLIMPIIS